MLKINVGLSRKVGEPNYGSRGASVNLEMEVESALVDHPDQLKTRVRQLFGLARSSVDEELGGDGRPPSPESDSPSRRGNGNHRAATNSQIRAIHAIADRHGADIPSLIRERFGAQRPGQLSIEEASALIDHLKSLGDDAGVRR